MDSGGGKLIMPTGNRDIGALGHPRSLQPRRKTEGTEQLTAEGRRTGSTDRSAGTHFDAAVIATKSNALQRETEQRQKEIDPHPISDHGLLIVVLSRVRGDKSLARAEGARGRYEGRTVTGRRHHIWHDNDRASLTGGLFLSKCRLQPWNILS